MLDGGAEDELGVGLGMKGNGLARLLEERELAGLQRLRRAQTSAADRRPRDRVLLGRPVGPALARLERYRQVVDRGGRSDLAAGAAVAAEEHRNRAMALNLLRLQIDTLRRAQLERGG